MNYFYFSYKMWMYLSCHMSCECTPTCMHPALKWLHHLIKSHKTLTLRRWHCMYDFRALTPTTNFCFAWQGTQPAVVQLFLWYSVEIYKCTNPVQWAIPMCGHWSCDVVTDDSVWWFCMASNHHVQPLNCLCSVYHTEVDECVTPLSQSPHPRYILFTR